ncbi:hypothetical protein CBL_05446 [Carabus blaptoides fortunei]
MKRSGKYLSVWLYSPTSGLYDSDRTRYCTLKPFVSSAAQFRTPLGDGHDEYLIGGYASKHGSMETTTPSSGHHGDTRHRNQADVCIQGFAASSGTSQASRISFRLIVLHLVTSNIATNYNLLHYPQAVDTRIRPCASNSIIPRATGCALCVCPSSRTLVIKVLFTSNISISRPAEQPRARGGDITARTEMADGSTDTSMNISHSPNSGPNEKGTPENWESQYLLFNYLHTNVKNNDISKSRSLLRMKTRHCSVNEYRVEELVRKPALSITANNWRQMPRSNEHRRPIDTGTEEPGCGARCATGAREYHSTRGNVESSAQGDDTQADRREREHYGIREGDGYIVTSTCYFQENDMARTSVDIVILKPERESGSCRGQIGRCRHIGLLPSQATLRLTHFRSDICISFRAHELCHGYRRMKLQNLVKNASSHFGTESKRTATATQKQKGART